MSVQVSLVLLQIRIDVAVPFKDDLVILSRSKTGLQTCLNRLSFYLQFVDVKYQS